MSSSPERGGWPAGVGEALAAAGLDVWGHLGAEQYDAAVPPAWRAQRLLAGARSAIVLASGGRALWRAFRAAPEFGTGADPLDAYTRRVAGEAAERLAAAGHPARAVCAFERRGGRYADFVGLAARAGLGAPSRLGLLVHPEYGPWLSLRALLLTGWPGTLPRHVPPGSDPCRACPAPCAGACPVSAPGPTGFDALRCGGERARSSACAEACAARSACVLGREHAYEAGALAHHMRHALPHPRVP